MAWFRVYDALLDNPKVQRLRPELFKALINLWCLAKRGEGVLPPIEDVAFCLRLTPEDVGNILGELADLGLLDKVSGGRLRPHDWNSHQYVSDNSTERSRKHRAQRPRNVAATPDATDQSRAETEQIQITEQKERVEALASEAPAPKRRAGTRLAEDFVFDDSFRTYASERGFSEADTEDILTNFVDHFTNGNGRTKTAINWDKALKGWIRRERPKGNGNGHTEQPSKFRRQRDIQLQAIAKVFGNPAGSDFGPPDGALSADRGDTIGDRIEDDRLLGGPKRLEH